MIQRILTVCTGNICRSPMAQALLAARLDQALSVSSAGVAALVGRAAEATAIEVCRASGLDITAHRARQADAALLAQQDLVLVMEEAHLQWMIRQSPEMVGRVYLLGHWAGRLEIPDPYGGSRAEFLRSFELVRRCCDAWAAKVDLAG